MGILKIKPNKDNSVQHSFNKGTKGYLLISEDVIDKDSTYIYQSINNTKGQSKNSTFGMGAVLPENNIKINSAKIVVAAKKTGDLINQTCVCDFKIGKFTQTLKKENNWNDYIESVAVMGKKGLDLLNNGISKNGVLPTITVKISTSGALSNNKATAGDIRITQIYIEIDYKELIPKTNFYIKTNGGYKEVLAVYKKVNSVYKLQTDIKSCFNPKTRYIKK